NAWGLCDMHGNTYEWCRDWYHRQLPGGADPDLHDAQSTATKSASGDISRVRRGGCWADKGWPCRSAFRLRFEPERRYDHIGFRVTVVRPLFVSGREHDSKPGLAAHHALVGFGGALQRIFFVHRPHAALNTERERVFRIDRCPGIPALD